MTRPDSAGPATGPTEPIGETNHEVRWADRDIALELADLVTPWRSLVWFELRQLTDTTSSKSLLVAGPLLMIVLNIVLILLTPPGDSLRSQLGVTVVLIQFGQVLVHASVIKLVTGEWLYRAVQPTLLVQPSRTRYFQAQAAVAWLLQCAAALLQMACTLVLSPIAARHGHVSYLLGEHVGYLVAVCALGSLLAMTATLTVSLLTLNPTSALGMYFLAVPAMTILSSLAPRLFDWLSPFTPVSELATLDGYLVPYPAAASLLLWLALLAISARLAIRRDAG